MAIPSGVQISPPVDRCTALPITVVYCRACGQFVVMPGDAGDKYSTNH